MEKGLNFKSLESQKKYYTAYDNSLKCFTVPYTEKYVKTIFGDSHVICCGNKNNPPLILLHAASCGSPIWYPNVSVWYKEFCIYAIDLIGETSKSILKGKINSPEDCAKWLNETISGLALDKVNICGLSIGAWNAANYASFYPEKINKLILLSPVQTFAKMYTSYFFKIMKMGFNPTRENVENYIGWGSEKETNLPDSIIEQFTLSVMNMNSYAVFPKWIKESRLKNIKMPVLVMFGQNEFAFSIEKAQKRARKTISNLDLEVINEASHLLSFSKPEYINKRVLEFLR